MFDPAKFFGNDPAKYETGRLNYQPDVIEFILRSCGIAKKSIIADIGAGSGKLGKVLAGQGHEVFFVEPNQNFVEFMRAQTSIPAERVYQGYAHNTGLPAGKIDLIAMGESAHWTVDHTRATLKEFQRILAPGGQIFVLLRMPSQSSALVMEMDRLMHEHLDTPGASVSRLKRTPEVMHAFTGKHLIAEEGSTKYTLKSFTWMTREGFIGYLASSSTLSQMFSLGGPEQFEKAFMQPIMAFAQGNGFLSPEGKIRLDWDIHAATGKIKDYLTAERGTKSRE